jgi:hypothetical protein
MQKMAKMDMKMELMHLVRKKMNASKIKEEYGMQNGYVQDPAKNGHESF